MRACRYIAMGATISFTFRYCCVPKVLASPILSVVNAGVLHVVCVCVVEFTVTQTAATTLTLLCCFVAGKPVFLL
jgi:hypothetical protein